MSQFAWMAAAVVVAVVVTASAAMAELPAAFSDLKFIEGKTKARDAGKLFVVDATAVWCGPCKKMDKTTWVDEKVVAWMKENAIAVQFDVDKEPELAEHLKIKAMPTVIVMRNEEVVDRAVGYQTPEEFLAWMGEVQKGKVELRAPEDVKAGGKADIEAHLDYARKLVEKEELDKATAEYAWLWENMLKHDPAYSGVRVSFMAGDMEELAEEHEPAKKRFTELRDATEARLKQLPQERTSPVGRNLRKDWVALNGVVGDEERSLTWYDEQRAAGVAAHEVIGSHLLREALEARGSWAELGAMAGSPAPELKRIEEMLEDLPDEEMADAMKRLQRTQLAKLYGSYLAADRTEDAEKTGGQALKMFDTAEMRTALVSFALKVGKPLAGHRAWLDEAAAGGADVAALRTRLEEALARAAS